MTRQNLAVQVAKRAMARDLIKLAVGGPNLMPRPSTSTPSSSPSGPASATGLSASPSIITSGTKPLQATGLSSAGAPSATFAQRTQSGPSFGSGYKHYFNKFYNPWSKAWNEPATDNFETALKWTGRATGGIGAAAGATAAGIVAAPAAGAALPAIGGAAATAVRAVPTVARQVANVPARIGAAVPEPVKQVASYATGLPLSKNVSTLGLVGSSVAQDVGYNALSGVDAANAEQGNPTSYRALAPMNYAMERMTAPSETKQPAAQSAAPPTQEQHAALHQSLQRGAAPDAPLEVRQQSQQEFKSFMQQQVDSNPQFKTGAADLVAGKSTPAAQEFNQHLESVGVKVKEGELRRLFAENPNPTPEQAGGFFAQAQQSWDGLPQEAKMMVGLGGGVGLVGLAMSLFGGEEGGGLMPMLMAILGLGGAALGAAGGGAFGDGAQQAVGSGVRGIANFFGAGIPEGEQDLSPLLAQDPLAAASQGSGMWSALTNPSGVKEKLQQAEQLKKLTSLPSVLAVPLLRSLDPKNITNNEQAQLAYNNAMKMRQELDNPESPLAQRLNQGQQLVNLYDRATGFLGRGAPTQNGG